MNKPIVDITPHPKILSVLGEIEFKTWQCIAELLDNSIDGFLGMVRANTPIIDPIVELAFGRDTVVVKDNGPGMLLDDLEMAVKAGWSSHERFGNLGLYGIGFNIATARLGSLTTIWTTKVGEQVWHGLEIDLIKMAYGGTYSLEVKTRTKSDPRQSGTEVQVSRIKPDWGPYLNNSNWLRTNVTDRLARVYGAMLREYDAKPIKFSLRVNGKKVSAWEHCVWPADWTVFRKSEGLVRPVQEIDVSFGKKYISRSTGETYDIPDKLDPSDMIEITERVYGWLGIQRYADETDFGVDILRNGRKIEVGCKDLFNWENANGNVGLEYPIDDPRGRGRIVGEIHLDHGYVHYTKHRFEREHSSWKQLLQAVRHNEPLTKREAQGYPDVNTSPLGLLYRVFRRNSPLTSGQTYEDILFIRENETAKAWARDYRKGNLTYRDDAKWRDEIKKSDIEKTSAGNKSSKPTKPTTIDIETNSDGETDLGLETGLDIETKPTGEGTTSTSSSNEHTKQRRPLSEFSLHITGIGMSGKTYPVEVYAVEPSATIRNSPPWQSRVTERGVFEIEVHLEHPAFNSTSLNVRDAVLADVAHYITSEETASVGARAGLGYGEILVALRSRYAATDSLDANHLLGEIEDLRRGLTGCFSKQLSEQEQRELLENLSLEDTRRIELAYARGAKTTPLVGYLEMRHLAQLLRDHPEQFFLKNCFNQPWTPSTLAENDSLLLQHREQITQDLWILMVKLGEFASQFTLSPDFNRSYLALIRACVNRLRDYMSNEAPYA